MSRWGWAFVAVGVALLALVLVGMSGAGAGAVAAPVGREQGAATSAVGVLGAGGRPVGPSATPTEGCGPAWRLVSSPNLGGASNDLYAIAAVSPADMWAVGGAMSQTLTMHWDGAQWSIVPSPVAGFLLGVAAVSSTNVWAVGFNGEFPGPYQSIIEHWNGAQWTQVVSPNPELGAQLLGIAAVSANDIWAVGLYYFLNVRQTLTLHWDGVQWNVVASPNATPNSELAAVTAFSTNDVWAAGGYVNPQRRYVPMAMHWDG